MIAFACLVLYLIPRTAVLGALLWTGYLGGAVATHARIGHPLLSHTLFPIYVMLLGEPFFSTFTSKQICETTTHTEVLIAISCHSRAEVDELVKTAIASGGSHAEKPIDHGFMYGWSFYDPDGHHWEVLWMDPAAAA